MRITAGDLKGRSVELPKGSKARPTTGLIREQVMNLLVADDQGRLASGPFLDIFAASGITGFEALSRGAPFAYFVESDPRHVAQIRRTAFQFGVQDRCRVLQCDARRCFNPLGRILGDARLSAAFIDPPYIPGFAAGYLPALERGMQYFDLDARLVFRSSERLPEAGGGLRLLESRGGGRARLYVFAPADTHGTSSSPER
jgi:16S rRNA (guanine966-N2)-methyltransferase